MNFFPDGLGYPGLLGDDMLSGPLYSHGDIWYVDSANGAGFDGVGWGCKERPFSTILFAVTQVAMGDIIVLAPTHQESLIAPLFIPMGVCIVGAGNVNGVPSPRITVTGVGGYTAPLGGGGGYYTQIHNVHFCASTASPAAGFYLELGGDMRLQGCQFDVGALDLVSAVTMSNDPTWAAYIWDSTFLVVSHNHAGGFPTRGLYLPDPFNDRYLKMKGVTFDGGTDGFSIAGADLSEIALINLHAWDITMSHGADMWIHADTLGFIHNLTCTGGAKVTW